MRNNNSVMLEKLFPLAAWITPNIPEAELICGHKLKTHTALTDAVLSLFEKYKCNVILKGGHAADSDRASDIVCCEGELYKLSSPTVNVRGNTAHGTGCTLSAAMAANFALNKSWEQSLIEAKAFVYGSLAENVCLSENLYQMFLPEKSYLNKILLSKDDFGMEAL
jgi:hydroxymethylpyrimidine/phosphomethylpyrimidine kinase